jgi:hypothetical protein
MYGDSGAVRAGGAVTSSKSGSVSGDCFFFAMHQYNTPLRKKKKPAGSAGGP